MQKARNCHEAVGAVAPAARPDHPPEAVQVRQVRARAPRARTALKQTICVHLQTMCSWKDNSDGGFSVDRATASGQRCRAAGPCPPPHVRADMVCCPVLLEGLGCC